MNIAWVISNNTDNSHLEYDFMSSIAPSWGSYKTWQVYKTDNCICTDLSTANEMLSRGLQTVSNFWVPESFFVDLGRPDNVQLIGGNFVNDNYPYKDDLVSLHLSSTNADIILMLGFDLSSLDSMSTQDKKNYYLNILHLIKNNSDKQFVLVNYNNDLSDMFNDLSNLSADTDDSVKDLLFIHK